MKPRNVCNHETFDTTKPMKPRNYETPEKTTKPTKVRNP